MKILKCKKALSPVVASIILIAVTVAVSIAVAAWMGALTFTFMGTEELEIQACVFAGSSGNTSNTVILTVYNKGTSDVTITKTKIGTAAPVTITGVLIAPGATGNVTISAVKWQSGVKYDFEVITGTGKRFPYTATAP